MTSNKTNTLCVCQSEKPFQQCCDRFLNQNKQAKTPLELMRSRYSAFALGGYGEYLLATWLPEKTEGMSAEKLSMNLTKWIFLEILENSLQGSKGFVEFKASFRDDMGKRCVHHEKSEFGWVNGRWLYVSGEVC